MKKLIIYLIPVMFLSLVSVYGMGRSSDDYDYWGHGFGMGYGSGCYEDRGYMMRDLGINKEQADKIADIDAKYRELYYKNKGEYNKINELRQEHRKAVDEVLNKSQRNRFNSVYNNRWGGWGRGHGRHHMGDYYGSGYGTGYCSGIYSSREHMMDNLNLTDDQSKKIADIDSKYRDIYYKNRGDYNKIDSLRYEHRKEIEKVLTPEQREKFNDAYNNRWRGWGPRRGGRMMGPGMMGN